MYPEMTNSGFTLKVKLLIDVLTDICIWHFPKQSNAFFNGERCLRIRRNTWLGVSVSILLANFILFLESAVEFLPQSDHQSFRQPFQRQLYVHPALRAQDVF
jgi:hypothetical protein